MEKGNIVKSKTHDSEGMILALTRDGKRAKVKVFGHDEEVWRPLDSMTVIVDGDEQCWKCGGSGIFYGGGMVENGVYKGFSGECYGCAGKGKQNNADRIRNHYYWHRQAVVDEAVAEAERGEFESLDRTAEKMGTSMPGVKYDNDPPARKAKVKIKAKKPAAPKQHKSTPSPVPGSSLIDCAGCGTLHRDDTMCPW
jgi:hypothetical protein